MKIITQSRNIPYYLQYLSAEIWESAMLSGKSPDTIYPEALDRLLRNQTDYFLSLTSNLTSFQRKMLNAIADQGTGNYENAFIQKYALNPVSSVQKGFKRLIELNLLEKEGNVFVLSDPIFEVWIKKEGS